MDALVVGAGIFGVAAAIELRERKHRVTLVDPGPVPHPAASSTDISKIVRLDYGGDAFYTELMEQALPRWRERFGGSFFHEVGFAVLSSIPMEAGSFELDSFRLLSERGHPLERLDGDEIARRFPAWRPGRYSDGYYNPQGGWAESGRVVAAYLERAHQIGVEVRAGVSVARLTDDGVETHAGDRLSAGCTIITSGAWTPVLVPELADRLRSVGQPVMHFVPPEPAAFEPPGFVVWAADIARTGWYGFPHHPRARVVKIANHGPGVPIDPRAERPPPDDAKFRSFARDSLPALADAPIADKRLCLYCDSFDGDLFIDRHPERANLVVAAGGSGHGFKFAPLLGAIIADAVEGIPNPATRRFGWRALGKERREEARHYDYPAGGSRRVR